MSVRTKPKLLRSFTCFVMDFNLANILNEFTLIEDITNLYMLFVDSIEEVRNYIGCCCNNIKIYVGGCQF